MLGLPWWVYFMSITVKQHIHELLVGGGLVKAQYVLLETVWVLKSAVTETVTQYSTPGCRYVITFSSL